MIIGTNFDILDVSDKIATITTSILLAIFTYLLYRIEKRNSKPVIELEWERRIIKREDGKISQIEGYVFFHNTGGAQTALKRIKTYINGNLDKSDADIYDFMMIRGEPILNREKNLPSRVSANSTSNFCVIVEFLPTENIKMIKKIEIVFEHTHGKEPISHIYKD